MAYLWNPDAEKKAKAKERKADRKRDRDKGVRNVPASVHHDAKTGKRTTKPAHREKVTDASKRGGRFRTGQHND